MTEQESLKRATETAQQTAKILKTRGWCFWKCAEFDGDIITVMRNGFKPTEQQEKLIMEELGRIYDRESDKSKVNQEWLGTSYTEAELKILAESSNMQFVHEAKKISGGILMPEENQ